MLGKCREKNRNIKKSARKNVFLVESRIKVLNRKSISINFIKRDPF